IGLMRSLTSEFTTADEATPMTKPMARPTTPKVWRKSMNSFTKPFFFSEDFSILSMTVSFELQCLNTNKTPESSDFEGRRVLSHQSSVLDPPCRWNISFFLVSYRQRLWFPSLPCRPLRSQVSALLEDLEIAAVVGWRRRRKLLRREQRPDRRKNRRHCRNCQLWSRDNHSVLRELSCRLGWILGPLLNPSGVASSSLVNRSGFSRAKIV